MTALPDGAAAVPLPESRVGGSRFRLVPFAEIRVSTEPNYLIKGLIPRVGLTVIWGSPKCGKSFLTFDMMMHVALGWEYRGSRVRQGAVVYCALEGADGFIRRAEAFRARQLDHLASPPNQVPFYLLATPVSLAADRAELVRAIRAALAGKDPAAIVLDTLNRSLAGSESNDQDMAAYIRAADVIRDAFGCAVVVVHHCGVDASRPRGHTSLTGAVDAQLAVKRDSANNIVTTVEWMKDGPEGEVLVSRLETVQIGIDDDGDPITSCIVCPEDSTNSAPAEKRGSGLAKGAQIALKALQDAVAEGGAIPPASNHIPTGVRTVSVDLWRNYAYRLGISGGGDRAARAAFKRAFETLLLQKRIGAWEPDVWPVEERGTPEGNMGNTP